MNTQVLLTSFLARVIRNLLTYLSGLLVGMDVMQQTQVNGFVEINSEILACLAVQLLMLLWSHVASYLEKRKAVTEILR